MIIFSITEEEREVIIKILISERYHKLLQEPETRDEKKFEQIKYLHNSYKK